MRHLPHKLAYHGYFIVRTSFQFNVRDDTGKLLTNPPLETFEEAKTFIDRLISENPKTE